MALGVEYRWPKRLLRIPARCNSPSFPGYPKSAKLDSAVNHRCLENAGDELETGDSEKRDVDTQQMKARLTDDILKGNTLPVLRRIRAADYGLDIDVIRQVLMGCIPPEPSKQISAIVISLLALCRIKLRSRWNPSSE